MAPPVPVISSTECRVASWIDLLADFPRRLRCLHCQRFHFAGDDGETPAGVAGARRFDRRIQRQEVRLRGDSGNQTDDRAHLSAASESDLIVSLV